MQVKTKAVISSDCNKVIFFQVSNMPNISKRQNFPKKNGLKNSSYKKNRLKSDLTPGK